VSFKSWSFKNLTCADVRNITCSACSDQNTATNRLTAKLHSRGITMVEIELKPKIDR
jgi:hypothetical protein